MKNQALDKIAISVKSHKLLEKLLNENPRLKEIMYGSRNETEALIGVKQWVLRELQNSAVAYSYYKREHTDRETFEKLNWKDYASIRLLDYIDNAGKEFEDLNIHNEVAVNNPIKMIWLGVHRGTGGAKPYFFEDMLHLFRQFTGKSKRFIPAKSCVLEWMERWSSGTDPRIVKLRQENRERIINILIKKMEDGLISDSKYKFEPNLTSEQKFMQMIEWWNDSLFHLRFAVRSPDLLNELLDYSLDPDTMNILYDAEKQGIPFFVNPYYLSLLHVRVPYFAIGADLAIRHYVVYSKELVDEFGSIVAWEKEDKVEQGKPNAAGWILPAVHSVHRRYPEVAILIPATMGRACGGLCSSCQRMYEFQNGHLNFNLDKLRPDETWAERLERYLEYFENDSQLRDILITGGDALMSSDKSLEQILDSVCNMAERKREANNERAEGEKYAEIKRVRLGTRLPVYLPQRITNDLVKVLSDFREKALEVGIQQFFIQTHFESPMEVTPESRVAIQKLISAGWIITNQLVFTAAASRRGHTAKLRQVLNDIGVLTYYTFSVKGYMENQFNFATNARAVQEQIEEKMIGKIPDKYHNRIREFALDAANINRHINTLRKDSGLPFLATDRNVLNMPGVGKSLTFRCIGITRYGRRILEFEHDDTRTHSPIIEKMDKIIIVESKSMSEYIRQLEDLGEKTEDYENVWGYSLGETEPRMSIYDYPESDFEITKEITNLEV